MPGDMAHPEHPQHNGCGAIDYDRISSRYDRHRRGGGPYLDKLRALAVESAARHVLEIGAGTGNNAQAFLDAFPCKLTALEPSHGMIRQARSKAVPACWVQGSATHVPLADASVGFLFGVYVLHHLADLVSAFDEFARVLNRGYAAFVAASTEFIDRHPMNRYFPSFARIDNARFQPIEEIVEAFEQAGFARAAVHRFLAEPRPIDKEYVAKVADRFISTYELIPADEFADGLRRLRADVDKQGRLEIDIVWESVTITGHKE